MAVEEWFLQEEGSLQFNGRPTSISYSPTSHCFIATLEDGSIEVLDVSSGRTLKRTVLEGTNSSEFGSLECRFCPGVEKLFVTDRKTVGLRKDLNGVLLLESILQAPVAEDCDAPITLELTLSDAKQLQTGIESCITTAVPPVLDVMETLKEQLKKEINQHQSSSTSTNVGSKSSVPAPISPSVLSDESDKAAKWNTCKLRLPAGALLCAFDGMVTSLHKNHRTSAALPIASAMLARVMALTGTSVLEKKGQPVYKQLMFVEAARRQTFSTWPHTDYKWAYPEAMAQAGFYHQPACTGDDRAMCFTCSVCLVCWEPTDEPWSEHERHSAECPFVRGERTENVPMCVSLATTPAKHHGGSRKAKITSISTSSCPCLLATCSDTGHIVVWDLSDQLKVYSHFMVDSEYQENQEGSPVNKDLSSVPEAWPSTSNNDQPIILDPINQDLKDTSSMCVQDTLSQDEVLDLSPDIPNDTAAQGQNQDEVDAKVVQQDQDQTSKSSDEVADSEVQHEVIEVSCEFNEDDDKVESSPIIEEPEETSQGIVEEPNTLETKLSEEQVPIDDVESSSSLDSPKTPSLHVTAAAVMCPPDQDHQHLKKLHTAEHKPVVIAGISPCLCANTKDSITENLPYLMLFDAAPEKNTTSNKKEKEVHQPLKPAPKIPSAQQYGGSQEELYDILSSDDELDQELLPVSPITVSSQSSLVKKCADAISGKTDQQSDELKMKHSNVVQKLMFPSDISEINSRVSQIIPCLDGHHVLVVVHLKEQKETSEISSQGETNVYLNDEFNYKPCLICREEKLCSYKSDSEGCLLLLYKLTLSGSNLMTLSEPLLWKKLSSDNSLFSVIGLPVDNTEHFDHSKGLLVSDVDDNLNSGIQNDVTCNGRFAGITQDGSIIILDANTLDTLTKFCPTVPVNHLENRFNDIVYCPGIDCLCCSTLQGNLYFLSLVHNRETTDSEGATHGLLNGADALIESISLSEECTIQNLLKLLQKTEFENLVPRFTAIVPPSWSEVQQEQQQRQHPQHLHQQSLGDATLHTRTWKLQPEGKNNATGEQIFELLLPKQCHVGHVDIKYTLNSSTNSSINVYLLKPWSLKSWQEEYNSKSSTKKVPILSAAKENGHILCGPIELHKGSHQRVALTCPDLVKTRHRILLLVFESSQSPCPLEEVSVTVRRFKSSPQLSCFMQYAVMLEEPAFHHRLVDIVCSSSHEKMLNEEMRKLALVLLCWIAGICVHTPIRKNSLIHQIQGRLQDIIPVCFLQSGRTVAHQCSILLLLCARQSKWDKKYGISKVDQSFRASLLQAVLQVLPDSINATSAGALHSLFSVLVGYAALADVKQTSRVCQEILTEVSSKMDSLMLHSHNMLQGRYGLYGLPLEPVLFDLTVAPTAQSSTPKTAVPLSTAAAAAAAASSSYPVSNVMYQTGKAYLGPSSAQREPTSSAASSKSTGAPRATGLQDLEGPTDSTQYLSSLVAHQGLLEVEPVHFTCTSTSDGARVERAESSQVVPVPGLPTASSAAGQGLSSMLPSVSVSEPPDIEFLKQHYQQLAKIQLQQHKQVLEKHKQELEELAMWSLFPKMLSKLEGVVPGGGSGVSDVWYYPEGSQPYAHYHSGVSVNLAQQKKLANRKSSGKKGMSSLTPIHRQHSQLPLPQALIIERLHSGARHHVILDFGTAMELTDIIIPSCTDLSSLSIDAWLEGEDKDAQRIAIVSDIGSCDCVLKDLHPPPVCQFVKLTVVGRPRSNAKVRMKIGEFYGRPHTASIMDIHEDPEHRLHMLENLYEEVHCHYSLACGKLESLLENSSDETKLQTIYQQCTDLQLQLNFVHHSISRLQAQSAVVQNEGSYDKMRVLSTCLAETLVALIAIKPDDSSFLAKTSIPVEPQLNFSSLTRDLCEVLFRNLCVRGNPVLRVRVAALLLHTCGTQAWWGAFLAQVLQQFFSSSQHLVFPQERVFVVLSVLAQQSPDISLVLTSLLSLLDEVLSSTTKKGTLDIQGIDISLVGWIVLLLAHILNTFGVGRTQATTSDASSDSTSGPSSTTGPSKSANSGPTDKWDFIVPSPSTQTNQPTSNLTGYRHQHHKLRRKISKHEKYLQKQQKKMKEVQGSEFSEFAVQDQGIKILGEVYLKSKMVSAKGYIKDLVKLRHNETDASGKGKKSSSSKSKSSKKTDPVSTSVPMLLSQSTTVPVMKKMLQLVLTMDSSYSVDLVLTICKVVALLSSISQPTVVVTDILSQTQVESILRLCVSSWGGPWTRHALITLLQDLIHGFKGDMQVFQEEEEEERTEAEGTSQPESKEPAPETMSAAGMQEIWSMVQNVPMEWGDPFISGPIEFTGYDSPPPVPSPPTSVTSTLVIPPKPVSNSETTTSSTTPMIKASSALDARLELGVTMESEWDLKTLQLIQTDAVLKGMTTSQLQRCPGCKVVKKQTSVSLTSIVEVFFRCFEKLFSECHDSKLDLGCLLELWLRLNGALPGSSAKISIFIPLSKSSMATMLSLLANSQTISLQKPYLAFEVMRLVLEKTLAQLSEERSKFILTETFVCNPDLIRVLRKTLIEGSPKDYGAETGVGTTGTGIKQVEVFLSSLAVALEKQEQSRLLGKFHNLMLDLLCTLSSENVHQSSGRPVQVKPILRAFLKHPPSCTKDLDVSLIMKLLQLTMLLSLQHLQKQDDITLRASSHFHETPRLTTSSHSLEGKSLNEPLIVHSTWLTKLLSLIIMLLQLPSEKLSSDSQPNGETSTEGTNSTNEEKPQESGSKEEGEHGTEDSKPGSSAPMGDASDSMVKTLQAMAKAVEKNATQTTEESQPIINVVEEESSTSASETETSAGEDEEALLSSETGNVQEEDKSKVASETNEENTASTSDIKATPPTKDSPPSPKPCKSVLPDQILNDYEICFNLLQCLNLCQSNNIGVLLTGANILNTNQNASVSGEPVSVEDGILQVLSVIFASLTHKDSLVLTVIKYLSGYRTHDIMSKPVHHVSEPFLWFLLRMLDSSQQVCVFREQGGYELLFSNLVSSHNIQLDNKTQDLIAVMRQLTKLAHSTSNGSAKLLLNAVWEAEKENDMVNYAPFGTISCTRPSAHPADALLKACAPHRRARSAAWSYHFYPGELWCDLNIQLPTPILLHAVYIQPHTAGLTTCPSYVALDYSVDGTVMIPASKPVMTSGLSIIKLQFEQPQIAQRVCIRCRRPRDSESLGLSQIKVWGTSLYGPPAENLLSSNQGLQSDCLHWICLLDHCLRRTPSAELTSLSSSQLLHQVFDICISLLGSNRSELFSGCQEDVLHTLSLEFPDLGQMLLKRLLVNPGRVQSTQSVSVFSSSVQLVFKLAKSGGSAATRRLRIIAEWLTSLSSQAHVSTATDNGLTGLLQAVAAVLWTTADSELARLVQEEFKVSLFRSLYEWSQLVGRQEPLKQAIDYLICSLCHVCPSYFQLLLHLTEAQSLVEQARTQDEQSASHPVFICNPNSMETLSRASQSPTTSHLLLASGVLNVLHDATYRLCDTLLTSHGGTGPGSEGVHLFIDCLSDVLSFMASCAEEPVIKSWFGETGSEFWKPLMLLLGSGMLFSPVGRLNKQTPHLPTRHRIALESAAITFFCQCIACHPDNQTLFSKLLCEVMNTPCGMFTEEHVSVNNRGVGLDGFLRRLVLEALLQDETIKVCIHNGSSMKPQLVSQDKQFCHNRDWHPRFGAGYNVLVVKAKLASTIEELDELVFQNSSLSKATEGSPTEEENKTGDKTADLDDLTALGDTEILEGLSIAAGINVKSKRARTSTMLKKISSQKFDSSLLRQNTNSPVCRHHSLLGDTLIPTKISLSSLANALMSKGLPSGTNCVEMSLKTCGTSSAHIDDDSLLKTPALTSALHKFASFDGLAILSSRLSCSVVMNQPQEASSADTAEVALPLAFPLPLFSLSASVLSRIPGHSLAAFGLFICLPGYSDVLLQDRPKAQCLLRLLLGAEDDGNGDHVLSSHVAGSLPTLPFQILRLLFHSKPLSSEEGVSLREVSLDQGAIQLVLMCLGVLSHHEPRVVSPTDRLALQTVAALTGNLLRGSDQANSSEKQYWAKGTGFGTGSTSSDWDIENAMKKQRAEEAHSTCMLQVIAAFIRPSDVQKLEDLTSNYSAEYPDSHKIPLAMMELLARSCLVPTLSSYLRNDSVLDMARHVPLYQAVLEVMRALATCPSLVHLLTPDDSGNNATSLAGLIEKMKQCVDTYSKTLRSTSQAIRRSKREKKPTSTKPASSTTPSQEESEGEQDTKESDAEGLALLIPDIQATATLVHDVLIHLHDAEANKENPDSPRSVDGGLLKNLELSNEEKYLAIMKPLQFDMYEIVSEEDNDRLEFTISYHFASTLRSATSNGEMGSPARARRLAQEITSLSTSLPLSSSSSVFVRCDETRLDIMKVLITGPAETPYANGCFEFDVYFPHNYPNAPMQINFETTGHHTIRFNPNLYNDGKVCLSILNTWHGRPEEKWNPQTSSFLQVLVSTQSLILVAEPYFNEPGYERSRGTPAGKQNSQEYNANIRQATVKWGMLEQLRKPCKCFKEVIESHFYLKKDEILQQCETWIREIEALTLRNSGGRAALHHLHSLRQHTAQLRVELNKLSPPKQLAPKKSDP